MPDDIDDIQHPGYYVSRRTFFNLYVILHGPGWLYVLGMAPRAHLPIFATLNPQSTCHGPRPGSTLAPSCPGGLPACPGAESTRKDPRRQDKKNADVKKSTSNHSHVPERCLHFRLLRGTASSCSTPSLALAQLHAMLGHSSSTTSTSKDADPQQQHQQVECIVCSSACSMYPST